MFDWLSHTRQATLTVLLAFPAFLMPAVAVAQDVGLARFEFHSAGNDTPIDAYVFYPAAEPTSSTPIGIYEVAARADATALEGKKPLVVISHGQGGSPLGHHDLATFLASHGYIVASLEHPKDNVRDDSGVGTVDVLLGRPAQLSALLDALVADRRWARLIDFERIGVAGFSMGGYTALILAGARPNFTRLTEFCRKGIEPAMCELLERKGASLDADRPADAYVAYLQSAARDQGSLADSRIRAAFVMAPMALVFDESGLADVKRPVYLHYATADRVLEPARNAGNLLAWLPGLAGRAAIVGADHWVYLAPCSPALAQAAPEICIDSPGIDRALVHRQVEREALAFFATYLKP